MCGAPEAIWKPGKADLHAAKGRTIPDVIVPNLDVLFCGINPGLYSAAVGHHFARPGNRFWPALYASGFTDRLMSPFEDRILPRFGLGLTNLVARGTASAAELSAEEISAGAQKLEEKIRQFRPARLAVLGVGACQHAFDKKKVMIGLQEHEIHGTSVWGPTEPKRAQRPLPGGRHRRPNEGAPRRHRPPRAPGALAPVLLIERLSS